MKKLFSILFLTVLVSVVLACTASASMFSGKCGDSITWSLDTLTGEFKLVGNGKMYDYTIANNATANTPWYAYRNYIKTVDISDGITDLGSSTFYDCDGITEIEIPSDVTHIGSSCFKNCAYIESLIIPDTVKDIEKEAFLGCIRLSTLEIGSGLTELKNKVFAHCSGLTDLYIPKNIKEVSYGAFLGCTSITMLTLSEGVESIGDSAFSSCTSLSDVYLPWSLKSISNGAFSSCSSLYSIFIPKSVTSIGVGAFKLCAEGFGFYGFYGTYAESFAETYNIPFWAEQTQIYEGPCGVDLTWRFDDSSGELMIFGSGDMYDFGDSLSPWYEYRTQIRSYSLEGDITRIGDYAFKNCYQIDTIVIPENVKSIGRDAFYGTEFFNNSNHWDIAGGAARGELYIDGCLIDVNELGGDYDVREGTRLIGDYAFVDTSPIVVNLPDSLVGIGRYAFANLPIIEIIIPESVNYIGEGAFSNCTSLTDINIPENVNYISAYMFEDCSMLDSFELPKHITRIGDRAFNGSSISDQSIYNTITYIGFGAFDQCYNIDNIYVYNDNVDLGPYALGTALATVIHGREGSNAQKYTELNGMEFQLLTEACAHQYREVAVTEASCTEDGETLYYCLKCDDSYGIVISAMGHANSLLSSSLPTCTRPGTSVSGCSRCGTQTVTETPALGHSFGEWNIDAEPQVGIAGSKSRACSVCGETETEEIEPLSPSEITGTCGDTLKWLLNKDDGVLTVSGVGAMNDYSSTGMPWYEYLSVIKAVVIEDGVTSIGKYAFADFTSIESVVISDSVTIVSANAFNGCTSLAEVTVGRSVTTMGIRAFDGCTSIKKVNIPDFDSWCKIKFGTIYSNPACYSKSFYINGEHTTEVVLTDASTSINAYAFRGTDIKKITIPASVTSIDATALAYTTDLVIYGYGETAAETFAKENEFTFVSFNCGPDLWWEVDTENGVLSITGSGRMFDYSAGFNAPWYPYYKDIYTVILSPDITSIGKYAFYNCIYIEEMIIPEGVEKIQANAFRVCRSLTKITIPRSVTSIGANAFYGNKNVTIYGYEDSYAKTYASENSITFSPIDSDSASGKCGAELNWTFNGNSGVLSITGSGAMYDYTDRTLAPWTPFLSGIKTIVIDEGVTYVGNYSFTYCTELTEITIPSTLYHMGIRAVDNSNKLKKVHIKDFDAWCGITFDTIGANPICKAHAFYVDGKHVTDVVLSDSVTEIKQYAFRNSDIKKITVPKSVLAVGDSAFSFCENITVYGYGETAMESYARDTGIAFVAMDCGPELVWSVENEGTTLNIEGSGRMHSYTQSFGSPWTPYRSQIVSVNIDSEVTTIGKYAFYYCTSLTKLTLPESLTIINENAFRICRGLETISIPEGVTSIGKGAFYGCSALSDVFVFSTDVEFGTDVFGNCSNVVLHGYSGSTAEVYAEQNGIPFVEIKEAEECEHRIYVSSTACTTAGEITYKCAYCGYVQSVVPSEAHGHSYSEWKRAFDPTCTEYGTDVRMCSYCSDLEIRRLDLLEHTCDEWEIVFDATCTEDGSKRGVCSVCSTAFTKIIPMKGHKYTEIVTGPTCTTGGYTEYVCLICNHTYIGNESESLGHSYTETVIAPTCTEGGYTEYICTSCGDTYIDNETEALGHSYGEWVTDTEASCTVDGRKHKTCSRCGDTVTETIAANGHSYTETVTAPTCTEDGYTEYTCTSCGDTYIDNEAEALGHSYGEWVTDTESSCTVDGRKHKTCSRCGDTVTETIVANGHSYTEAVTAPTCTEGGYTEHICTSCGDTYIDNETEALGHSYGEWITDTEASCTVDGTKHKTCSACSDRVTESISATGHSYEASMVEPTCTETGSAIHTCSVCGEKETVSVIPAKGHKFGDWITDRQPTATEWGLMHRECQVCDYTEEKLLDPVGETPDAIFTLSSVTALPGETVKLTVSLKTSVAVNSIALKGITYDSSCLEFIGFADYEGLDDITALPPVFDSEKMNIIIAFAEDTIFDGTICSLEFKVSDTAIDCVTSVTATPIVKLNSDSVTSDVDDGEINVQTYVIGDIDGDDDVDIDDAVLLFCYSMIPEEYPIEYTGDVDFNKDGNLDIKDAVALFNYSILPDIYPLG